MKKYKEERIVRSVDPVATGKRLKCLFKMRGFSTARVADMLGISPQAVNKWFNGESIPSIDKLLELQDIFEINIKYLVRRYGDKNSYYADYLIRLKLTMDKKLENKHRINGDIRLFVYALYLYSRSIQCKSSEAIFTKNRLYGGRVRLWRFNI